MRRLTQVALALFALAPVVAHAQVEDRSAVRLQEEVGSLAAPDLATLSRDAHVILVGRFVNAKAELKDSPPDPDGFSAIRLITTLRFELVEVIKGDARLSLATKEGVVEIDDGGNGEYRLVPKREILKASTQSQQFTPGRTYVIYGEWWDRWDSYLLMYNTATAIDVTDDVAKPLRDSAMARPFAGKPSEAVLREIREKAKASK